MTAEEAAPGGGVEAEVGLVEEGERRPRGQSRHDRHGRELAAGELADLAVQREPEHLDELVGEVLVPVRQEQRAGGEDVADGEGVRVGLVLPWEAELREHCGVVERLPAEHLQGARTGAVLAGDQGHERGLAGTVGTEQSADGVAGDVEADVLQCTDVSVAAGQAADADGGARGDRGLSGEGTDRGREVEGGRRRRRGAHRVPPVPAAPGLRCADASADCRPSVSVGTPAESVTAPSAVTARSRTNSTMSS